MLGSKMTRLLSSFTVSVVCEYWRLCCSGALAAASGRFRSGRTDQARQGARPHLPVRGHHHRTVSGLLQPHSICASSARGQLSAECQPGDSQSRGRPPAGKSLALHVGSTFAFSVQGYHKRAVSGSCSLTAYAQALRKDNSALGFSPQTARAARTICGHAYLTVPQIAFSPLCTAGSRPLAGTRPFPHAQFQP